MLGPVLRVLAQSLEQVMGLGELDGIMLLARIRVEELMERSAMASPFVAVPQLAEVPLPAHELRDHEAVYDTHDHTDSDS